MKYVKSLLVMVLCLAIMLVGTACNSGPKVTVESTVEITGGETIENNDTTNNENVDSSDNTTANNSSVTNTESDKGVSSEFIKSLKGMTVTIAYPGKNREPGVRPIDDEWSMVVKEVAKELGITIKERYDLNYGTGEKFITDSLAGKNVGNIVFLSGTHLISGVKNNAFVDLDEAINTAGVNLNASHFSKGSIQASEINDSQYALGFNATGDSEFTAIYYNVDMVTKQNKLEDPLALWEKGQWTFDTFEEYCKKLTKTDSTGAVSVYGCQLVAPASMSNFIMANGGGFGKLDANGKWNQSLNDSKTLSAFNFIYKTMYTDRCIFLADGAWGTAFQNLYDGKAAMVPGPAYCATNAYMRVKDAGGLGIVPLPVGPNGTKDDVLKVGNGGVYAIPAAYEKDAAKYVYILNEIGKRWIDRYESIVNRQYAAVFLEDKYLDMFYEFASGKNNSSLDQSTLSLISDETGYSLTKICSAVANGTSPSTIADKYSSAVQNAQNDQQGDNRFTGFN